MTGPPRRLKQSRFQSCTGAPRSRPCTVLDVPILFDYNVGMRKHHKVQYTIRGVPAHIDRGLRRLAHLRKVSLNRLLADILCRAVGEQAGAPEQHHDLDGLIGSWVPDSEFDRALAEQSQIDEGLWR